MNGFGNTLVVLCTGITCNQHVDADGKTDEQADNHVIERTDRADGCKRLPADKTPDDDGIRCVKEQLKDA